MGLLATLTRSTGVVLAVPLVLFYLQSIDWQWRRIRIGMALGPCSSPRPSFSTWPTSGMPRDDPLLFAHVESRNGTAHSAPALHHGVAGRQLRIPRGCSYKLVHARPNSSTCRRTSGSPNSGIGELTNLVALVVVVGVMALGWRRLGGALQRLRRHRVGHLCCPTPSPASHSPRCRATRSSPFRSSWRSRLARNGDPSYERCSSVSVSWDWRG